MLAVDISNYTGPLTPELLHDFQASQVSKVIVQAVDPPSPPYPVTQTKQQIDACVAAGMPVEAYIYFWNAWPAGVARALALLSPDKVSHVWLDVEDVSSPPEAGRIAAAIGEIQAAGFTTGIYTAKWYWPSSLGVLGQPLWVAQYDGVANLEFAPFGEWTKCEMKQYKLDEARAFGLSHYGDSQAQILAKKLHDLADEVSRLA